MPFAEIQRLHRPAPLAVLVWGNEHERALADLERVEIDQRAAPRRRPIGASSEAVAVDGAGREIAPVDPPHHAANGHGSNASALQVGVGDPRMTMRAPRNTPSLPHSLTARAASCPPRPTCRRLRSPRWRSHGPRRPHWRALESRPWDPPCWESAAT